MKVLVLGAGSFGAALAWNLARKEIPVDVWCRSEERAEQLRARAHNSLPGVTLPAGLEPVAPGDHFRGPYELAIAAVPTQYLRTVLKTETAIPTEQPWVSAAKGIEIGTGALPSEILRDCGVTQPIGILSGPSHAEEVVRGVPTAVVLGHPDASLGRAQQELLSSDSFRVYHSSDPRGVELGGALKNVIALAAGIAVGQGFGDNSLAALVTRGSVEMARLGAALGGEPRTFSGLSGVGDLIVTCFSEHSRNRSFGVRIGRGESPREILQGLGHVVEGVHTARAVFDMARNLQVEMPIAEAVYGIVHGGEPVDAGIRNLLQRSLKDE